MRRALSRPRSAALAAAAVFAVLFVAPAWTTPAAAHAIVRETRPAIDQTVGVAPNRVVMRFNEPVDVRFGGLRVYDTDGRRVDRGTARHPEGDKHSVEVGLRSGLADGTYTVSWRVVSADGHPITEAFVFHVGSPGENPEGIASQLVSGQSNADRVPGLLAGVARFIGFAGLLLVGGAVAFAAAVDRAANVWRVAAIGTLLAALGAVALFLLHGPIAADLPLTDAFKPSVWGDVAGTRFGAMMLLRLGALAVFALLAWLLRLRHPLLLAVPVVVALATPGLAGHAGTTSPVVVNVVADTVHMAAAAAWIGGLVVLLRVAFPALAGNPDSLAGTVDRFSRLAMACVAVLVVTGVWRSFAEVRSPDAVDTPFGLVLLAKVAAFLPLVALGYVNQRVVRPRLDAKRQAAVEGARALRRNVGIEAAVAVVVLALTAVLVNLPPARTELAGGPVLEKVQLDDMRVDVLVTPGVVGENEVHVTVFDSRGRAAPVAAVEAMFRQPSKGIGPIPAQGRPLAPAHYVIEGRQLSVSGRWNVELVIRTSRFDEKRTTVAIEI